MNAPTPFDTLSFADRLKDTRLGRAGAETLSRAMAEVAMANLVTKADLEAAKHSITVRMGGMMLAATTIIVAVLGALISLK